ncbi:MAG: hypothetical protein L6R28_19680 [Planctomycetes bacterium]|nr:hypothetical protein [Planctomycetota bacterium]
MRLSPELRIALFLAAVLLAGLARPARAGDADEWKIKRKEGFEFASPPQITRDGDHIGIAFTAKDYCDATVAIENADGRIIRHLGSGVLGENAPPPFQKGTLTQKVVWDGKDDSGKYIDDKENHVIRVSLGLKPQFEKSLLWVPQRRLGSWQGGSSKLSRPVPLMCAAPEGMYVYEGAGVEHLRLFDRDGNYVRTVYPFPANKLDQVVGLNTYTFPQDGQTLPHKKGFIQATLLTSGATGQRDVRTWSMYGAGATAFTVSGKRIAMAEWTVNRLATDGSTGGLPLSGPKVTYPVAMNAMNRGGTTEEVTPMSLALSPDGKYLYLSGYLYRDYRTTGSDYSIKDCLHGVVRMEFAKDDPPKLFAGSMDPKQSGSDDKHFTDATSVTCDAQGRVYVTDYMNDRIQVFDESAKLLKSIKAFKPVRLDIHPKTGEIYVFSWMLSHDSTVGPAAKKTKLSVPAKIYKLGPFDNPRQLAAYDLPLVPDDGKKTEPFAYSPNWNFGDNWAGLQYNAVLDPYSDPIRVWTCKGLPWRGPSEYDYVRIHELKGGKFTEICDFSKPVRETFKKWVLPMYWRQRLYANQKNGKLYVAEQHTAAREKAFREILEVDPKDGKTKLLQLPFDCEDMAFGPDGLLHMREKTIVGRYDPETFREVPFDYGEEATNVTCESSQGARATDLISGLPIYCGTGWHIGGMTVSVKGHLGISCYVTKGAPPEITTRNDEKNVDDGKGYGRTDKGGDTPVKGRVFKPDFYPGRMYFGEVHIFDVHGKSIHEDVVKGLPDMYGLGVDKDDNLYLMASPTRVLDGKMHFNEMTGTLMKFRPGKGKIICGGGAVPMPLREETKPKRPPDGIKGSTPFWVEGADWKYGGVGFCGKNSMYAMGGCACYNSRFYLDYFGRSFAPEIDRSQVAVLDTNGNLIMRIGRYGNVDSAGPKSQVPLGGDEVGIVYGPYIATFTDRYLWVADTGNQRVASVRLDYHTNFTVALKDVPDAGR